MRRTVDTAIRIPALSMTCLALVLGCVAQSAHTVPANSPPVACYELGHWTTATRSTPVDLPVEVWLYARADAAQGHVAARPDTVSAVWSGSLDDELRMFFPGGWLIAASVKGDSLIGGLYTTTDVTMDYEQSVVLRSVPCDAGA